MGVRLQLFYSALSLAYHEARPEQLDTTALLQERRIAPDAALDWVFGYAVGLDMTRRDLQAALKAKGRSW